MGRKRVIKIPKTAKIKCPNCQNTSQINISKQETLQFFECKKCKQKIQAPITKCCIICAFSDKKCPNSLKLEALSKNLQIKDQ